MKSKYYFNIPVSQWDLYIKHIIEGIYGIKNQEYTLVREHNGIKRIELEADPQIPLINSLPVTIHTSNPPIVYYSGDKLTEVASFIINTINDFFTPGGKFHSNTNLIILDKSELGPIIHQLALNKIITKFAPLSNNQFIVYIFPHPITVLVKITTGTLVANIYSESLTSTFDVDDGYTRILTCMNPSWLLWKEKDDITAPIQSPNYV